jgi:hypothetical protein
MKTKSVKKMIKQIGRIPMPQPTHPHTSPKGKKGYDRKRVPAYHTDN